MRLEKPATRDPQAIWVSWWLPCALAILVLSVGFFSRDQILLWAITTALGAPLTLVAVPAMFLLPGLALLRLLWPDALPPTERWPLAVGVSSALPPLLLLLSEPFGLRWNSWSCWGYLVLSALVLIWPRHGEGWQNLRRRASGWRPDRQHLLLIAITAAAVLVRLYAARDLVVGPWGDSYQHTIMAQLLVDHGGLFSSWQPYAALQTFTYHYGFHSNVAWLHWLSGEPVTSGLLVVGQVQSALAAPLAYLLTRRLLGNVRAALWAALIVGFVSAMPAYYLNWGRYTQLAGQTILPAVCVIWMALQESACDRSAGRRSLLRLIALTAVVTAGLALTHYRVAVFAACFVISYSLYLLLTKGRLSRTFARLLGVGLAAGALTLLLVISWLLRLREGALLRIGNTLLSANIGADQTNALPPLDDIFALHAKYYLVGLALLGILSLLLRRDWRVFVLPGWAALVWVSANPYLVGLNGAGLITNFAVVIASYLVLAPLAGVALAMLSEQAAQSLRITRFLESSQALAGAAVLVWGLSWQQRIAAPEFQLFTPADARAMDWIRQATPSDAQFFVNSFPAYGGSLYAGSDGGWWLPFMSGRRSNLPPLTYGSEAGEQASYARTVNTTNAAIERYSVTTSEAAAALRGAGYRYLYDGPAASPPDEYIKPVALARSPLYQLVYSKDGVTIWRVR